MERVRSKRMSAPDNQLYRTSERTPVAKGRSSSTPSTSNLGPCLAQLTHRSSVDSAAMARDFFGKDLPDLNMLSPVRELGSGLFGSRGLPTRAGSCKGPSRGSNPTSVRRKVASASPSPNTLQQRRQTFILNSPLLMRQSNRSLKVPSSDDLGSTSSGSVASLSAQNSLSPCHSPKLSLQLLQQRLRSVVDPPFLVQSPVGSAGVGDSKVAVTLTPAMAFDDQHEQHVKACMTPKVSRHIILPTSLPGTGPQSSLHQLNNNINNDNNDSNNCKDGQVNRRAYSLEVPDNECDLGSQDAGCDAPPSPSSYYRVVVLGEEGVGKTTLVRQMSSAAHARKCSVNSDDGNGEEEYSGRVVVSIDRCPNSCALEILDNPLDENLDVVRPDAFVVMYSVSDRKSFVTATEVMQHLRCVLGMDRPVLLVANKTDLRRQDKVSAKEAKDVAETYDCIFVETSATLRHNIDTLMVRLLDAITLKLLPPGEGTPGRGKRNQSKSSRKLSWGQSGRTLKAFSMLIQNKLRKQAFGKK